MREKFGGDFGKIQGFVLLGRPLLSNSSEDQKEKKKVFAATLKKGFCPQIKVKTKQKTKRKRSPPQCGIIFGWSLSFDGTNSQF